LYVGGTVHISVPFVLYPNIKCSGLFSLSCLSSPSTPQNPQKCWGWWLV